MSKKLKISQLILERNISTHLITKLYNMCENKKLVRDSFTNDSNFVGDITTDYTYDEYITLINEYFPSLRITPKGLYILFEDQNVQNILMEYVRVTYPDKNYEGVIKELAFSNSDGENNYGFRQMYKDNTDITKFNEISKLVNCKYLATYEFCGCTNLVSVDLTNIQKLCNQAFYKCYNLEYFNGDNSTNGDLRLPNLISDGLAYPQVFSWINNNGIYFGPKIKRIMDLGNCTSIGGSSGGNTFAFNTMLEYINPVVFTNITYIHSAFEGCTALIIDDLKLPRVSTIGYRSFYRTQVKKISELGLCNIEEQAFRECTELTEITQEALNNILSIGEYAFHGCTSLTELNTDFPNLEKINNSAFESTGLIKADLSKSKITSMPVSCFRYCTSLTEIRIPKTVTTLREYWNPNNINNIKIVGLENVTSHATVNWGIFASKELYPIAFKNMTSHMTPVTTDRNKNKYCHSLFLPKALESSDGSGSWSGNILYSAFSSQSNTTGRMTFKLLYYRDIQTFGYAHFLNVLVDNLVINNVTPPQYRTTEVASDYFPEWQSLNGDGSRCTICTIWVPDSAVNTYKANPTYSSFNIKGINSQTNGQYDLPRWATFEDWENDALECEAQNLDYPVGLIEEWM